MQTLPGLQRRTHSRIRSFSKRRTEHEIGWRRLLTIASGRRAFQRTCHHPHTRTRYYIKHKTTFSLPPPYTILPLLYHDTQQCWVKRHQRNACTRSVQSSRQACTQHPLSSCMTAATPHARQSCRGKNLSLSCGCNSAPSHPHFQQQQQYNNTKRTWWSRDLHGFPLTHTLVVPVPESDCAAPGARSASFLPSFLPGFFTGGSYELALQTATHSVSERGAMSALNSSLPSLLSPLPARF